MSVKHAELSRTVQQNQVGDNHAEITAATQNFLPLKFFMGLTPNNIIGDCVAFPKLPTWQLLQKTILCEKLNLLCLKKHGHSITHLLQKIEGNMSNQCKRNMSRKDVPCHYF